MSREDFFVDSLLGKEVLDAEGCQAFVPGITTGWEALESALSEPIR